MARMEKNMKKQTMVYVLIAGLLVVSILAALAFRAAVARRAQAEIEAMATEPENATDQHKWVTVNAGETATASDRADKSEKTTITPDATAGQATAQQPATAAAPAVIAASIARFADASIPLEKRMAEIEQLGQRGDADAVQTLMTLGDTYTYLNFQAIEALGRVKTPEVARYLVGKTNDTDPKIVAAAMRSLAQVQGAEAIPVIAATLAANRQRPDGFQDTVCAAGVKALGGIGSAQAIPALAEEFEKTVGKTLQHEYGSQVVAAFKAIGDPSGVPALEAYAQRLQTQRDAMGKNPMGQHYLEDKIKEVREAITFITRKA